MPRELPGFYFDEERNRYFPLSSRPKSVDANKSSPTSSSPVQHHGAAADEVPVNHQRRRPSSQYLQSLRNAPLAHERIKLRHNLEVSCLASSSHAESTAVPIIGGITAFAVAPTSTNGEPSHFLIGDSHGWIYRATPGSHNLVGNRQSNLAIEFNLNPTSEISSMSLSGSRCIATAAGSEAKIAVINLDSPSSHSTIFSIKALHEIWTSHLSGQSLVVGAEAKGVYLSDVEVGPPLRFLETHSDVFAVHQNNPLVYTGSRSGGIMRFDIRSDKPDKLTFLTGRFGRQGGSRPRSSVVHLDLVRDWQLLVSCLDGQLASYDLRFLRETRPVHVFNGHVNSLTRRLGIAVDPQHNFLYAAGEDNRIRGWSLQTGQAIETDTSHPLFGRTYTKHISAMHIVEERTGLTLHAADEGDTVFRFYLGQKRVSHIRDDDYNRNSNGDL